MRTLFFIVVFLLCNSSGNNLMSGFISTIPSAIIDTGVSAGSQHKMNPSYQSTTALSPLATNPEADAEVGTEHSALSVSCLYGHRPSKPVDLISDIIGPGIDQCVSLSSPALLLMGGGTDVDSAFSLRVGPHIQGGNIVVLRTSGTNAYNTYLRGLTNAASVETIIVDTVTKANTDYVDWAIRSAEFVWLAGGDQSAYLNAWKGTKVQAAIQHVYDKGGVVGGTSAGDHVLSQHIYDPDGVAGAISAEAVTDFCHETINISTGFLNFPALQGVINDTHFRQRDRMGRSIVFQAKIGAASRVVAISEATSLFVNSSGQGIVDGANEVYILKSDAQTQYIQTGCGLPVKVNNLLRYKLVSGDQYNLTNNSTSIVPSRISLDGSKAGFYRAASPY